MGPQIITQREKEVLELVSQAYSTKEIGAKLNISSLTVMTHRRNLIHKMGAKNTAGLVRKGFEHGLLRAQDSRDSNTSARYLSNT